ncbi:S-layer homology domain-containing protein [Paenibacillus chungangensis]|uniref:S-layer homology domain-containing protein n=1 Tax=Paenibacillus chungangensis TaxID=696535 RepID=A0ABW3HRC7_9BACL
MIRFMSSEEVNKTGQRWKKGVISTLSAALVVSPMVAMVPAAVQAAPITGAVPAVGDGTSVDPYIVTTPEELYYMNTARGSHFKLGANIDLGEYEWSPIVGFAGTLDGDGHYINNLKITQYHDDIGLFGTIASGGSVKNIGILNADIVISSGGFQLNGRAGIIAGSNNGMIENGHVSGQIKVMDVNINYISAFSRIDGGLVGSNGSLATIRNSLAQVDVKQEGYAYYDNGKIGGLAGENWGNISNSYFVGIVKDEVEGHPAYTYDFSNPGGSVGNAILGSSVTGTYWDSTVGGSIDNGRGGIPKSTEEMMSQQTYASGDPGTDWDFDDVWAIQEGVTYPFLRHYQPQVVQEVVDTTINVADGSYSIDLASSFADPAGDALTITAVSSDPAILTVQVNGNQLMLTPIASGTATVTATALNPQGAVVTDSFIVTVAPAGTVTGAVYGPGNSPISGASVSIGEISVVTDAEGQFTLTDIAPGSHTVTVSSAGYHNGTATVTVTAGQSVSTGNIVLAQVHTTGTVTGAVYGPDNSPINGASVSIGEISVVTDAEGQFTLTDIAPGSHTVTVSSAGYHNGTATVTVTAGQSVSTGNIVLAQVHTTGTVTGAVYGPGNSPINGASVSIGEISVVTDAEGQFTLTDIAPGNQTINVSRSGYYSRSATVTVSAGESVSAGIISLTLVSHPPTIPPIPPTTPEPTDPEPTDPETTDPESVDPTSPAADTVFNSSVIDSTELRAFLKSRVEAADQSPASQQFTDTNGHWAQSTIHTFAKLGVIEGYGDGQFMPNAHITRAQFAAILNRVFHLEADMESDVSFTDITGHWGSDAILRLAQAGVINGYPDATFQPDEAISREEMVVILTRLLNLASLSKDSARGGFTDLSDSYAAEEIEAAVQAGIIQGKSTGLFQPKNSATRAEALTIMMNILRLDPQVKQLLDSLK